MRSLITAPYTALAVTRHRNTITGVAVATLPPPPDSHPQPHIVGPDLPIVDVLTFAMTALTHTAKDRLPLVVPSADHLRTLSAALAGPFDETLRGFVNIDSIDIIDVTAVDQTVDPSSTPTPLPDLCEKWGVKPPPPNPTALEVAVAAGRLAYRYATLSNRTVASIVDWLTHHPTRTQTITTNPRDIARNLILIGGLTPRQLATRIPCQWDTTPKGPHDTGRRHPPRGRNLQGAA